MTTTKLTPYEQQRLKNIELNKELLASLDIPSIKNSVVTTFITGTDEKTTAANKPMKKLRKASTTKKPLPTRKSSRLRGEQPLAIEIDKENNIELLVDKVKEDPRYQEIIEEGKLLTAEEYFNQDIIDKAIKTDGHFKGWVNPIIIEKYGLEASAAEAWEKNGGGTWSIADPTGNGKKRKKGSSNAKADALKMFKKNPNQYFYRHNEPGEEQWTHEWSEEEKGLFLRIAREYGCGDKWGLFASYIPHRLGYQCSSFYRHEIIKNGLVIDPNFQFTSSGEPIYVGSHNTRR
ncbi:uncharacterized protein BX663DRAFT_524750 [Cokeromyces recurvatus]|uniref:uncharacterized protein n=1 Tax=Cokeromyces recurvatus TaxID=90255 RepID=UPI00221FE5AD|nr:uncharacterized protein BX663DRAFT_524750 [Cokeromyces recurvatus]KAI7898446.1 hypothetical protein BX663DRAFT_524750 [Cokeromyces recurvatus]